MKRDYSVYYQTGGTGNFKWQFTFETYTRDEADAKVMEINKAGYPAHRALTKQIKSIGLPETFDSTDYITRVKHE